MNHTIYAHKEFSFAIVDTYYTVANNPNYILEFDNELISPLSLFVANNRTFLKLLSTAIFTFLPILDRITRLVEPAFLLNKKWICISNLVKIA